MEKSLLPSLATIILFGMAAQWLAWRLRLPSILLLLLFGFVAGPAVAGLVDPDEIFGELLFPVVSLFVGVILFEGGLSLRLSELREVGRAVRNLISVGVILTWLATTGAAWWLLELSLPLAMLFGAILTVTGPTVIGPLLRHVRPTGRVASVLKWEGIVNDPIGAMLSVLVFEAISLEEQTTSLLLWSVFETIIYGFGLGLVSVGILVFLLRRYLIPDFLHNAAALSLAIVTYSVSNMLQHESGLLAVTVMGVFLINQKRVNVKHIVEFKENLRVLLISLLFIVLASRLRMEDFEHFSVSTALFLVALVLVIRPAVVFLSTLRTKLSWRERGFLAWMAPRGVVAAAVASVFALRLQAEGMEEAERLVPLMFLVIITTVTVYGLTAAPLARWLGLAHPNPQGALIVGAHRWARTFAKILQEEGFRVLVVDTNWENISAARMMGLPTFYGSVLSDYTMEELSLDGIGRLLAMTPNDEVNTLAALHFIDIFGRQQIYQLAREGGASRREASSAQRGRILFGSGAPYSKLEALLETGAMKKTRITEEFDLEDFHEIYGEGALPLCVITETEEVQLFTEDKEPAPKPGQVLVALIPDPEEAERRSKEKYAEKAKEKT